MWVWGLSRVTAEEKRLAIQCGDRECKPRVFNAYSSYIVLYKHGEWWFKLDWPIGDAFTDANVKQIKGMAQFNYNMYCEKERGE